MEYCGSKLKCYNFNQMIFVHLFQNKSYNIKYENAALLFVGAVTLSLTLAEIACYIKLYIFIYKKDNGGVKSLVKASVIHKRNKTNAITLSGQFAGWIMEIWYIVLIGILNTIFNFELFREVAPFLKDLAFLLIPMVQIMTSEPIKQFKLNKK
jgi:hypothetical protein